MAESKLAESPTSGDRDEFGKEEKIAILIDSNLGPDCLDVKATLDVNMITSCFLFAEKKYFPSCYLRFSQSFE
jgi:hypothetical protein